MSMPAFLSLRKRIEVDFTRIIHRIHEACIRSHAFISPQNSLSWIFATCCTILLWRLVMPVSTAMNVRVAFKSKSIFKSKWRRPASSSARDTVKGGLPNVGYHRLWALRQGNSNPQSVFNWSTLLDQPKDVMSASGIRRLCLRTHHSRLLQTPTLSRAIATHTFNHHATALSILPTKVDVGSTEFKSNAKQFGNVLQEIQEIHRVVQNGGPQKAKEKHIARGKMLPREWILSIEPLQFR